MEVSILKSTQQTGKASGRQTFIAIIRRLHHQADHTDLRYFQLRGLKDVPLVPQDDQSIPVFLVCSPSSVKAIHVHLSDTVLQLKTRIYEVVKIPPIYQFLICPRHNSKRGRIENDGLGEFDMTLEEFGIQKASI